MRPVPVLWVSGAPGVGKSTAGWGLYSRLRALGQSVAYLDVDQVGLFCPDPPGDPDRRRLQAANAMEVLTNFTRHGATQLIVSGVVDPQLGIDSYVRHAENLSVTLVRLRADWGELRRRYLGRGFGVERLDELMVLAAALDRNDVGAPLDVSDLAPEEVIDALIDLIGGGGGRTAADREPAPVALTAADGGKVPALLITGPTAVGKSTVGWDVFATLSARGVSAAYIDVDQLGFIAPASASRQVKGENMGRLWRGYRATGAQCLIVAARDVPGFYEHYFEGELVTSVHLDAAPADLADRVARRAAGGGPRLAGDDLFGAPEALLTELTDRAATEAREFRQRAGPEHTVIDTSAEDRATVTGRLLAALEPTLP
jgi:adenylylsulfate kinase-like enzyme